jgi:LPXTG-motif cell wall-anchored protein
MKYYGTGITVEVRDHSGNLVETRNIDYSSLTAHSDSTWTYTIPETDTTPYHYTIKYQTVVDMDQVNGSGVTVHVDNTANGNTNGTDVTPAGEIGVTKNVESFNTQEVTWVATLSVPEKGLSQAVVTDTLPVFWHNNKNNYDLFKDGSLDISGLLTRESYDLSVTDGSLTITFYQDTGKTSTGLQGQAGGHTITVKLTTKVNQDWLNASYEDGSPNWWKDHVNKISFNGKQAQATVTYSKPGIEKTGLSQGNGSFMYTVVLSGVSEVPVRVKDTFDTNLLEVDTSKASTWNHMKIWGGNQYSQDDGRYPISYTDTPDGILLTANSVPMMDNGQYYPYYKIIYYLKLKDGVDLEQLAIANGGEHHLVNTAKWGDHESKFDYTTTYDYLNKELLNKDDLGTFDDDGNIIRSARYRITFNSQKATLNNGEPMEMTDVMSANLSMDYSSIRIITDPAGQTVPYSLSGGSDGTTVATYTVPDSTKVIIEYTAQVRGTGKQTIINTVSVKDEHETIEELVSNGTAEDGKGSVASFKIVKVDGYDSNKKLAGVQFKIFADNPEVDFGEKNNNAKELILTTDENGEIELDGDKYKLYYYPEVTYHVQEVAPLPDYAAISFDYLVTLTDDMDLVDYSENNWIYYYNDSMQIKNYPLEGLIVEKKVESSNNTDKEQYYKFKVSVLKDDGTVNTDYNASNKNYTFENGVCEFELRDKDQMMFWGFETGTKYKVEEIDSKGLTVSYTYSTYDENGNVTGTTTVSGGGPHTGTLTQQNEIISFTNSRTENGALKLTKLVTVNGQTTTGTAANGEYTFTITGPGTATTVNKTVVIKVENGVATQYKIDNAASFTNLPADKFVVISDLAPGVYTITETKPTNGTSISKINNQTSTSYSTTVKVVAGDTAAAQASATFTNNIDLGSLEITKKIKTNGVIDASKKGTFYFAVYKAADVENGSPKANTTPAATGEIKVTGNGSNTVTISDLPYGTYYVYELDEDKNPIVSGDNGALALINGISYTVISSGMTATVGAAQSAGTESGNGTGTPAENEVTLINEVTDFEFTKIWKDVSQNNADWPENQAITVTVSRKIQDGNPEPVGTYTITKTSTGFTIESENAPALTEKTGTEEKKYTFQIQNLPKIGTIKNVTDEYTYFVTETVLAGYNTSYTSPTITGTQSTQIPTEGNAGNGGTIINTPEGSYELPQTGGIGTTLFTALGGLMTVTAGAILTLRRTASRCRGEKQAS